MKNTICDRCNKPIKGHVYQWNGKWLHENCVRILFEYAQASRRNELSRHQRNALSQIRIEAHRVCDAAWRSGRMTRDEMYHEIASHLGLTIDQAHIGRLNERQCQSIIHHFSSMNLTPIRLREKPKRPPKRHSIQYRRRRNELRESALEE